MTDTESNKKKRSNKRVKQRVMFTCAADIKDFLETWASDEGRTISNLVEQIVNAAVAAKKSTQSGEETENISQITDDIDAGSLLKLFASGKRPRDAELIAVANEAEIEEEQLWRLRDRLFPQRKKTSNGAN